MRFRGYRVASRNVEDERRMAVRLSGILGSVTSHPVAKDDTLSSDETEVADETPAETTSDPVKDDNFTELE